MKKIMLLLLSMSSVTLLSSEAEKQLKMQRERYKQQLEELERAYAENPMEFASMRQFYQGALAAMRAEDSAKAAARLEEDLKKATASKNHPKNILTKRLSFS